MFDLNHNIIYCKSAYINTYMKTLHTFGCSITQGYALPDVVNPVLNENGEPYTKEEINAKKIKINWEDIHILKPSDHAWPKVLADKLNVTSGTAKKVPLPHLDSLQVPSLQPIAVKTLVVASPVILKLFCPGTAKFIAID